MAFVAQLTECFHGLTENRDGLLVPLRPEQHVAEVVQRTGFVVMVTQLAEAVHGVAGHLQGLVEPPGHEQGAREVRQRRRLVVAISEPLTQLQRLLLGDDGFLVPPHLSQRDAEIPQRQPVQPALLKVPERVCRPGEDGDGLVQPLRTPQGDAEVPQGAGLSLPVVEFTKDLDGRAVVVDGLLEPTQESQAVGDLVQRVGFERTVVAASGHGERAAGHGEPVVEVSASFEEHRKESPEYQPFSDVAHGGGGCDEKGEVVPFLLQPGEGFLLGGEPRPGRDVRSEMAEGHPGCLRVVREQPLARGLSLVLLGVPDALFLRVQAQEVVHLPASPTAGRGDQVGAGQIEQDFLRRGPLLPDEGGRGLGGDARTGVEGQEAEQSALSVGEVPVGEVEGGPYGALAAFEVVQPGVGGRQVVHQVGQGACGHVGEHGGRDPQGEGQAGAELRYALGVGGGVVDAGVRGPAPVAQGLAEQFDRVRRLQDVEVDEVGVEVQGVARGDERPGGAVGRHQWPGLLLAVRVVDDEDPPALLGVGGQHRPVQPRPVLRVLRNDVVGHAQGAQQAVEGLFGADATRGVVARQVGEEDAAGEPARLAQRTGSRLQHQFGLADPAEARHRRRRRASLPFAGGQQVQQFPQFGVPAGEGRRGRWKSRQRGRYLRRQPQRDVPALHHRAEEDPTTDLVGHPRTASPVGCGIRAVPGCCSHVDPSPGRGPSLRDGQRTPTGGGPAADRPDRRPGGVRGARHTARSRPCQYGSRKCRL